MSKQKVCPPSSSKRRTSGDGGGDRKRRASSNREQLKAFCDDYPELHRDLKLAYNLLQYGDKEGLPGHSNMSLYHVLFPLKIEHCDAHDSVSFSKCYCKVEPFMNGVRFFHVFPKGCDMLVKYLNHAEIPEDTAMQAALCKLLSFLKTNDEVLASFEITEEEILTVFLMNHLVIPLSSTTEWIMDKGYRNKTKLRCPCSLTNCPMRIPDFSDTSIESMIQWGYKDPEKEAYISLQPEWAQWKYEKRDRYFEGRNLLKVHNNILISVMHNYLTDTDKRKIFGNDSWAHSGNIHLWHGSLDALAGDSIATATEKPIEEDPGIDSAIEMKVEGLTEPDGQLYGQTIVFSFLQHMFQKDLTFVPVLGLKKGGVRIMMYDSKQDIFLTSNTVSYTSSYMYQRIVSYLMVWLACNYKIFSKPLTGDASAKIGKKKAGFHELYAEKLVSFYGKKETVLRMYEKKLQYGHTSKKMSGQENFPMLDLKEEDVAKVDDKYRAVF